MARPKKPKIKVKEIKSKIKFREIPKEQPLEEIAEKETISHGENFRSGRLASATLERENRFQAISDVTPTQRASQSTLPSSSKYDSSNNYAAAMAEKYSTASPREVVRLSHENERETIRETGALKRRDPQIVQDSSDKIPAPLRQALADSPAEKKYESNLRPTKKKADYWEI